MSLAYVTRISRMKDMWYIFVPKVVQEKLREIGIEHGSLVLWKEIRAEDNSVVLVLEVVRTSEPITVRKVAKA